MRVYFDASVIIAALLSPTGGSSLLFAYIKSGIITGITSETVVAEILDQDKSQKLNKSKQEIEKFIAQSSLVVREHITKDEIEPYKEKVDMEDAHLIAGALLTRCSHLVTLDKKHLLRADIKNIFLPLKIISPKELLEEVLSGSN